MKDALFVLNWIVNEPKNGTNPKHIVIIADEFTELLLTNPDLVEKTIVKFAQLPPKTGIHLILSTQRPARDVITPLIKEHAKSLMAFNLASEKDSMTFLGFPGAEKLKGAGDFIYLNDEMKPVTLQAEYKSDEEIQNSVSSMSEKYSQNYNKDLIDNIFNKQHKIPSESVENDPLYKEAIRLILEEGASIDVLMRKLSIGYARASRLMNKMRQP